MMAWDSALTGCGTGSLYLFISQATLVLSDYGSCSLDGLKASCWSPARTMLLRGSDRASYAQMQQIPLSSSVSPSVFTGVSMSSSRASVVHQRISAIVDYTLRHSAETSLGAVTSGLQ